MKLFYAPNSPFARKVRIVLREAHLLDRIDEEPAPLRNSDSITLRHGPTGRVPALLTDSGAMLLEADMICRYLADADLAPALRPDDPIEAERDIELDGVATALMEAQSWRAREKRFRPEAIRSTAFLDHETARCMRCYDWLEAASDRLGPEPTLGRIGLVVALATADQALIADPWRDGRRRLAGWYEAFAQRPSVAETTFPGW